MSAMKLLTQIKASNAKRIQRAVRRVLYKPMVYKDENEGLVEKNDFTTKFTVSIYQ
jgi:hypothetical protein